MKRALLFLAFALISCGGSSDSVTRLVGGNTLKGRFVEGDSYAWFLRGAAAEDEGKWAEALTAYEQVSAHDDEDAEIFSRIARVKCAIKPGSGAADARRALAIDSDYGPAHEALAACGIDANEHMAQAAQQEPKALSPQLWLSRLEGDGLGRLVALSLDAPSASAHDALASYAAQKGQGTLAVEASLAAARRDDRFFQKAAERAKDLAGAGDLAAARALSGGLADLKRLRLSPLVARLAVDDAIVRGDRDLLAARRATVHVPIDEACGRALLLGRPDITADLAALLEAADPKSTGAHITRIAAEEARGQGIGALASKDAAQRVSAPAALAYARALARVVGQAPAQAALAALPHDAPDLGDALATSVSVDLAARGVLPDQELALDAKLELALRRRTPVPEDAAAAARDPKSAMDARHRLLFLAWTAPASPECARLAERLTRSATRDPLVGAAMVRIASATHQSLDAALRDRLAASAPADPLIYATLLDASPQNEPLKRRLAAVAATKAEHDLSSF